VLNPFYACFEEYNTEFCVKAPVVPDDCVISLLVADVNKSFKQVNTHEAAGPDGTPGCALKAREDQLASVLIDILNLSLVPVCNYA
jgi:hypothetical protein